MAFAVLGAAAVLAALALAITVPGNDPGETLAALEALAPG